MMDEKNGGRKHIHITTANTVDRWSYRMHKYALERGKEHLQGNRS